jgi:hypothetical protein
MVMADDRQKKNASSKDRKKTFLMYGIVLLLLAGAYFAGRYYRGHKYDSFAKCIADKQAKMYGLYWCPHCADQKRMFGESFQNVPYIECAIRGSHELAPECKTAGVKLFPSWQFGSEAPKEGVLSLNELSQKTGCKLP